MREDLHSYTVEFVDEGKIVFFQSNHRTAEDAVTRVRVKLLAKGALPHILDVYPTGERGAIAGPQPL